MRLDEIVARFGGELIGDPALRIDQCATLDKAGAGDIAFLANRKYESTLAGTRASAVILASREAAARVGNAILTAEPYLYYARLSQHLNPPERAVPGIAAGARVAVAVPPSASIAHGTCIEEGAEIGEDVVIGPNCSIGRDVKIGAGSRLYANVTIYRGCCIGQRAIIHAAAVIGADGFGFAREKNGAWVKIPQIGRVVIGDDVEIGAGTTIDRGALDDTVIEDGVKLDNQIQIAHNVHIGAHTAMAGCVGVAGSTVIGKRCTFGGAAMIIGHLTIGDDVNVSSGTLVAKNILKPGNYTGSVPFLEHSEWLRNFARIRHLESLDDKIRTLENRLAELEARGK